MRNPCKGCPRKGCGGYHDKCPEYLEMKQALQEAAARRESDKLIYGAVIEGRLRVRDCRIRRGEKKR